MLVDLVAECAVRASEARDARDALGEEMGGKKRTASACEKHSMEYINSFLTFDSYL